MVAHFTMHTYGVHQAFRFIECIWSHRKSRQIRFFSSEKTFFTSYVRNICSELPSYKSIMNPITFFTSHTRIMCRLKIYLNANNLNAYLNIKSIKYCDKQCTPQQSPSPRMSQAALLRIWCQILMES